MVPPRSSLRIDFRISHGDLWGIFSETSLGVSQKKKSSEQGVSSSRFVRISFQKLCIFLGKLLYNFTVTISFRDSLAIPSRFHLGIRLEFMSQITLPNYVNFYKDSLENSSEDIFDSFFISKDISFGNYPAESFRKSLKELEINGRD